MKLKNYIKSYPVAIFLGVIGLTTTSCNRFLDTEPITDQVQQSDNIVVKNAADAESKLKSIYSEFGGEYWQLDNYFNGDAQTDVAYAGADNVQNFQQDEYRILATNTNVNRDWNYLTALIYKCNILINYIDQATDLTATRKAEILAEAKTMRALANFHGVQLWGDYPLVTKAYISVSSDNFDEAYTQLYPTRKPASEVYQFIISDLESVVATAPASSNKFKVNKGAINALLAKLYATKPSPDYAKSLQYCNAVIADNYTLLSTYDQLFDGMHEGNSESIWEANGEGWGSTIGAWSTFMFTGTDWKKFNVPSNDLVKSFNDEGDVVRKATSVKFATSTVNWSDAFWASNNYPFLNKQRQTDGTQNFYIFRLADILLLKSEALAKTGDLTGAAVEVNKVRTRAGLGSVSFSSADDAINKILWERKLELAFEGHRWFDLKRTGKAIAILSAQKDGNGTALSYAANINQNRLLWPVPQAQIDKNPNLTQNSGY
ncbi:SusD-like protein [Chryseobacterium aquaeductus]|uniref:SusD-like protein n=1 Tax=Chryseobacterium aquaeductus TaxID=2675056 RepID=A0A9N8QVY7_9FLAO|nr:RagB/SusD family nutrient uptake outer membrane protein [Chryseobacterium aquaeductus]CAA7332323.1 SusD-like protein [Chryseobacterium potabilaquae]CAD7815823.1 SusD-like protein [Chryseobacterium aquaeductus]